MGSMGGIHRAGLGLLFCTQRFLSGWFCRQLLLRGATITGPVALLSESVAFALASGVLWLVPSPSLYCFLVTLRSLPHFTYVVKRSFGEVIDAVSLRVRLFHWYFCNTFTCSLLSGLLGSTGKGTGKCDLSTSCFFTYFQSPRLYTSTVTLSNTSAQRRCLIYHVVNASLIGHGRVTRR